MVTPKDFKPRKPIDWCAGCGNFGIIKCCR